MIQIEDTAYNIGIHNATIDTNGSAFGITNLGTLNNLTIENCEITSTAETANHLINIDGRTYDITIKNNLLQRAFYPLRLKGNIKTALITNNEITQWKHYGIFLRGGPVYGPNNITISNNYLHDPLPLLAGARQMIVALGDPTNPIRNILQLSVLYNKCVGPATRFDPTSETSIGTGDQIVLHYCEDFKVIGNKSYDGGENGMSITRFNVNGEIADNDVRGADGHGIQLSRLDNTASNLDCHHNHLSDNGQRREDFKTDTMASIYCQDGEDNSVHDNYCHDTLDRQKYGLLISSSRRIIVRSNDINSLRSGFVSVGNTGGSTILP